jgi:hypothetical protein
MKRETKDAEITSRKGSLRDAVSPAKLMMAQTPETMARSLLEEALLAIHGFGLDAAAMAEEAVREFHSSANLRELPRAGSNSVVPLYLLSEVLERWYSESEYLDYSGDPRPLPVSGSESIATIVRTLGFEHLLLPVVQVLAQFGLIRDAGGGRFVAVRRDIIGVHAFNAFIALSAAVDALTVAHRNIANATTDERWLQRTVLGVIPQRSEPEFRARLNALSVDFLHSLDDYLVDLAKSASSEEKHVFVRLHMFASI